MNKVINNYNIFKDLIETIKFTFNDCPWTKSLKPKKIMEYLDLEIDELNDAIEKKNNENIIEEIGDIIWNLFSLIQLNFSNNKNISFDNILDKTNKKMIERYTWVSFRNRPRKVIAKTKDDVEKIWNSQHDNNYGRVARLKRDISVLNNKKDKISRKRRRSEEKLHSIELKLHETKNSLAKVSGCSSKSKKKLRCCVFCSSSKNTDKKFLKEAEKLGKILSENNIDCINGGGLDGCMGELNKTIYKNKGKTIGITHEIWTNYPNYKKHKWITEEIISIGSDLSDRKKIMKNLANFFVALPGGFGTFDEIMNVISNISIGLLKKTNIYSKYK